MSERTTNDEAARWAVRLEEAQLSADEQGELDAWLAAAPHHPGALIRARAVWLNLGRLGALAGPTPAPSPASAAASAATTHEAPAATSAAIIHGAAASAAIAHEAPPPQQHGRRLFLALAASLAVASLVYLGYRSWLSPGQEYETGVGEVRRIALEDGSAVTLNSDTRATVLLDRKQRIVRLEHGEGLFEVARDPSRPFLVRTGEVSVRALGTTFAVRTLPDDVTVTVAEGTVEVARRESPPQRVTVNEQASVQRRGAVRITAEDESTLSRQLAWRTGVLSFSGETLAEAVRQVNRYSRRKVTVTDTALAEKPVVGIFRIGDVDAFARAAAGALDAEVHSDDQGISLTPSHAH